MVQWQLAFPVDRIEDALKIQIDWISETCLILSVHFDGATWLRASLEEQLAQTRCSFSYKDIEETRKE